MQKIPNEMENHRIILMLSWGMVVMQVQRGSESLLNSKTSHDNFEESL